MNSSVSQVFRSMTRRAAVACLLAFVLPDAGGAQGARTWKEYSFGGGLFSISFPERSKVERFDAYPVWRNKKEKAQGYRVRARGRASDRYWSVFFLRNVTYPEVANRSRRTEQALDAYVGGVRKALEAAGGKVTSVKPISSPSGHPGRYLAVRTDGSIFERQIFLVDTVLYELDFVLAHDADPGLDGDSFFRSFRPTASVAPGSTPLSSRQ
jgi:hypothetical protein